MSELNNIKSALLKTTELGKERIQRNVGPITGDVVEWCRQRLEYAQFAVREGKNWYVYSGKVIITVNASSHTIITAHRRGLLE